MHQLPYLDWYTFHTQNPHVYQRIVQLAERLHARGVKHYSMRGLFYVLRYESELSTSGAVVWVRGEQRKLKLKNAHSPYYTRLLQRDFPQLGAMFNTADSDADGAFGEPEQLKLIADA